MEVKRIPSSELTHHGKDGQKWGVMHGPPYPLDKNASVQAKKKKKSLMTKIKDKRKGKMLQKAKAAKKVEREEKEKIINSGDASEVKKIAHKLNDEEMERALKKIQFNDSLNSYIAGENKARVEAGQRYLQTASTTMQAISNMATAASNVYTTLDKFGIINKPSDADKLYKRLKRDSEINKMQYDMKANNMKRAILNAKGSDRDQEKIDKLLGVSKKKDKDNEG